MFMRKRSPVNPFIYKRSKRRKSELTSISYLPPYCRNADHEFFPSLINFVRRSMFVCSLLTFIHFLCEYIMANAKERTFIMIKPDGVQRGLVGKIIQRFEEKGYKLVALKMVWPTEELLKNHYSDLSSKPFFPGLVKYMSSGPVVPMVWEGLNAVKTGRVMLGETDPKNSAPGTIRGDFCLQVGRNIIHGSDSVESANKEIKLWFGNTEKDSLIDWASWAEKWIYE